MGVRPTRIQRRKRRDRRRVGAIVLLVVAVLAGALVWTAGYRHRVEASATDAILVDLTQAPAPVNGPAFHTETVVVTGHRVVITRNGPLFSAVTTAGSAGTAKRDAVVALRRLLRRVSDEQLRLALDRSDLARQAYAANDADVRNALAASGATDLRHALDDRALRLAQLETMQRAAQNRDARLATGLAVMVAQAQQDLFDLRSLADRVAAATLTRDRAAADIAQAQAAIARWRSTGDTASAAPITVHTSVQGRSVPLRAGLTFLLAGVAMVAVLQLASDRRHHARRTDRARLPVTTSVQDTTPSVIHLDERFIDLTTGEEPAPNGVEPADAPRSPPGDPADGALSHPEPRHT